MSESAPFHVEIEMLREFYVAWVELHKIPRDKLHRRKQELAAQELLDRAHQLKNFYRVNEHRSPIATGLSANG